MFTNKLDGRYNKISSLQEVRTSTSSALDTTFDWFTTCTTSTFHARCNQTQFSKPGWYPTRLIDIGKQSDANWNLRVLAQDGISDANASYMTLSYRWGQNPTLLLLRSNIDSFRAGRSIRDLPLTFREFFTVARRFSINYVWIDALCIIQDSEKDWEAEAPTMRYVYANSACNVAASASCDPEGGLFRTREPESLKPPYLSASLFSDSPNTPRNYYMYDFNHWDHEVQYGPLHRRGWVYQETLLAPRVLFFGAKQVLWECLTMPNSEFHSLIDDRHPEGGVKRNLQELLEAGGDSRKEPMPLSLVTSWMDSVETYSGCVFTRPSDKLFAFSGIAKLFQGYTKDVYIAGMWKSRLPEMMGWYVVAPRPAPSSAYRAPSWSWASIDGPVREISWQEGKNVTQVLDVQFTPGSDPTVDVSDAYVRLKAKSALIAFKTTKSANSQGISAVTINGRKIEGFTIFYPDFLGESTVMKLERPVTCLLLVERYEDDVVDENREALTERGKVTSVGCLILDRIGSDFPIRYRRLGWMDVWDSGKLVSSLLESASITEITII